MIEMLMVGVDAKKHNQNLEASYMETISYTCGQNYARTPCHHRQTTQSSHVSSEKSLIEFPTNPPAGFPIESPMDSLASSSETSPGTSLTRSAAKRTLEDDPDETFSCTICLDTLNNSGSHQPACLKCGHIFGEKCLIRWIEVGCDSGASRCPTCNSKASLEDIRVLYTKNLIVDTPEITALEHKLEQENRDKNSVEMEKEKWRVRAAILDTEVKRLKTLKHKELISKASTSDPNAPLACIKKITICKNQSCRVMAFNKNNLMLVMSQQSDATTFNAHVIRKMDASLLELSKEYICAHTKQIRDMVFHPLEHNHLASVGLDTLISLTDLRINKVVSSIRAPDPLWSCCWAGDNTNLLVVGGQTGSEYYIDRRFLKLFESKKLQSFGCVSLNTLPPSTSRSFSRGGFLKTRIDQMTVFEQHPVPFVYKETELPLEVSMSCTSYDSQSNLVLTSLLPFGPTNRVKYIIFKFAHVTKTASTTPVIEFYGGDNSTKVSRPCLVPSKDGYNNDTLMCCYDEGSSTIKLFNINKKENIYNMKVTENFLYLCPLPGLVINGRRTVAGLSENAVSIFSV